MTLQDQVRQLVNRAKAAQDLDKEACRSLFYERAVTECSLSRAQSDLLYTMAMSVRNSRVSRSGRETEDLIFDFLDSALGLAPVVNRQETRYVPFKSLIDGHISTHARDYYFSVCISTRERKKTWLDEAARLKRYHEEHPDMKPMVLYCIVRDELVDSLMGQLREFRDIVVYMTARNETEWLAMVASILKDGPFPRSTQPSTARTRTSSPKSPGFTFQKDLWSRT
jgi:hypothetical protein